MNENIMWKDVVGFEGLYKISEYGDVMNKDGHILAVIMSEKGYKRVHLWRPELHKATYYLVHRLVAQAFVPNPSNLPIVLHKDNVKLNTHYTNLKWGTYAENAQQAYDDGLNTNLVDYFLPVDGIYRIYDDEGNISIFCSGMEHVKEITQWQKTMAGLKNYTYHKDRRLSHGPYKGCRIETVHFPPAITFEHKPKSLPTPAIKFY